jgi:non-ribosomal peptide synthetase-like protein
VSRVSVGDGRDGLVVVAEGCDHSVRWRQGERLEHLFEERCDWMQAHGWDDHLAVDAGDIRLTFDQLDRRANQLARHLLAGGARSGDRIGLLFDHAVHSYVGMLAVLKINAVYVPLDVSFPPDRLASIAEDSGMRLLLSLSHIRDRLQRLPVPLLCVDEAEAEVSRADDRRLTDEEKGEPDDQLCYIIYTSGSTGRPKGVAIEHPSICNFVRVAVEVYGMRAQDRVYQGMTIAFDFSIEEIWVPLVTGATLVPKPPGSSLLGQELQEFLRGNDVTALCCVPTLLSTFDEDLPGLRFLLVSGESCPQELVTRWHSPDRRFLNVYGPTEATVTATWTVLDPDRQVTIGVPLPTYAVVILDPDAERALPRGETGEIGIAGIGLASGYVNRDDLTKQVFIPDFLGIEGNTSGRIYRTGDLGRVNDDGEIEYHGRIDTQVKVRGYRIELAEVESVLLEVPEVAQAVVGTYEPEPGVVELVGYYSPRRGTAGVDQERVYEHLRGRLPAYMVPAYLEELTAIPRLASDKADRKHLPAPRSPRRLATRSGHVPPGTRTEEVLAGALAQVLQLERVSVDHHFFDDLGGSSLLMAQFCARVREHGTLPSVAMRDVYLHPTVRRLAALLDEPGGAGAAAEPGPAAEKTVMRARTSRYVLCGALQVAAFLGSAYLGALLLSGGYRWISASDGLADLYLRSFVFADATFLGLCAAPIVAKWLLVGRWKPEEIPLWGLGYLRFWLVKTLLQTSPLMLFVGSPLYSFYLRALGARVGSGVAIFTRRLPVCTDLLTIGDGTVIRKDTLLACYRARGGRIQTGRVTLGRGVLVCEESVLDIDTSMGDGAQLGHCSSLHATQAVPDGEHWHGSPARPSEVDYQAVEPARCGALKRAVYTTVQLGNILVVAGPLAIAVATALVTDISPITRLIGPGPLVIGRWTFYRDDLLLSAALFFGSVLGGLALVVTVPRALQLLLRPGKVYPLYGVRYWVQRAVARLTNLKFYTDLFGDSSYIVHYLGALGYDLSRIEQTGSNFGPELKHDSPYLSRVGSGTMVSDGLSMINAEFSSTSFKVSPVSLGAHNFLGNGVVVPSRARTGDNCLLATKVMVPIDGEVRENVGLLGSPCFEIPRAVRADTDAELLKTGDELRAGLAAKNRYNLRTMALFLLVRWGHLFGLTLLALIAADLYDRLGVAAVMAATILILLFSTAYLSLVERASTGFRALRPQRCSIYDPYFWWHERLWKLLMPALAVFNGTPMKGAIWRLLGVRVGPRLFDDGCAIPERTLVTIGGDCTLNAGTVIQCHSMEEGVFKTDRITLGAGCTVGVNAFVHYGVTMGEGTVLEANSFLMKGGRTAPRSVWGGNPASETRAAPPAPAPRPEASVAEQVAPDVRAAELLEALRADPPPRLARSSGIVLSLFSLAACQEREEELIPFLAGDEQATARAMPAGRRRSSLVISRALARMVLSVEGRDEVAPQDWHLGRTALGKPVVLDPAGTGIDFSIAHAAGVVAVALSDVYRVGVDVEPAVPQGADPRSSGRSSPRPSGRAWRPPPRRSAPGGSCACGRSRRRS